MTSKSEKNNENGSLIHKRISQIMVEMPGIAKDKTHEQNYMYRSIDAVCEVVHELLAKHNIFYTPKVVKTERLLIDRIDRQSGKVFGKAVSVVIEVEYKFFCSDDYSTITVGPIISEALDYSDKASAKAMTMALKTMLLELFCIPVQNNIDPDASGGNGKSQPKSADLIDDAATKKAKTDFAKTCFELAGVKSIPKATLQILLRDAHSMAGTMNIIEATKWAKERALIGFDDDGNVWMKEKD